MASGKTKLSQTQPRKTVSTQKGIFLSLIGSVISLSALALKNYLLLDWVFTFSCLVLLLFCCFGVFWFFN